MFGFVEFKVGLAAKNKLSNVPVGIRVIFNIKEPVDN